MAQGRRFQLYDKPEEEWLEWLPFMALVEASDASRPHPVALELSWRYRQYLYLTGDGHRRGWGLPVEEGILAPEDLLLPPADALEEGLVLKIGGKQANPAGARPVAPGLALLPLDQQRPVWSADPTPALQQPEPELDTGAGVGADSEC